MGGAMSQTPKEAAEGGGVLMVEGWEMREQMVQDFQKLKDEVREELWEQMVQELQKIKDEDTEMREYCGARMDAMAHKLQNLNKNENTKMREELRELKTENTEMREELWKLKTQNEAREMGQAWGPVTSDNDLDALNDGADSDDLSKGGMDGGFAEPHPERYPRDTQRLQGAAQNMSHGAEEGPERLANAPHGAQGARRRAQSGCPPGANCGSVQIYKVSVCDHMTQSVHGGHCAKHEHRRAQSSECTTADLGKWQLKVTRECCGDEGYDCKRVTPRTCDAGCAEVFLPFWRGCADLLSPKIQKAWKGLVAKCQATQHQTPAPSPGPNPRTTPSPSPSPSGGTGASLARQLNLVCADDAKTEDCIPHCSKALHGSLLLLSINGDDSKFSCELRHALYSWVAPATDGGYLGTDFATFFSAVVSGAAGLYAMTLTHDAGIDTDLTIRPGQVRGTVVSPPGAS
jgi:hypothetical protein